MTPDACDNAIQRMPNSFRMAAKEMITGNLKAPNKEIIREETVRLQRALLHRATVTFGPMFPLGTNLKKQPLEIHTLQ